MKKSIRVSEPSPEMQEKIRRARCAIVNQKMRMVKCPYYVCSTNKHSRTCSPHSISAKEVEEKVFRAIHDQIELVVNLEKALEMIERLPSQNRKRKSETDAKMVENEEAIRQGHERMQELDSEHPCSDERLDKVLGEYQRGEGLTYELARALISAIYVHGQDSIEIVWKFKDIFEEMEGRL